MEARNREFSAGYQENLYYASSWLFDPIPKASLNAPPITPDDLIIPISPAIAMAPIPIGRTYNLNIISADMSAKGFIPPWEATILPTSLIRGINTKPR